MTPLELRLHLHRNGYAPLPLIGKAPVLKNWQQKTETNAQEIALWPLIYPGAINSGALTEKMPTADIDIQNEEAARAAEEIVRANHEEHGLVLVRFGRWPKRAIPFRTDEPFKKIVVSLIAPNGAEEKIEFLGDGQQVAVAGLHPTTGQPYRWHGGEIWQTARDELPYIREAEAHALVDEIVEMLCRDFGYRHAAERPKKKPQGNGHDQASGAEDWGYLYSNIYNGHALHDSLRDLAAKLIKSGTGGGAAVNQLRALMQASTAPHDARWQERYDDIQRAVEGAVRLGDSPPIVPALGEWDAGGATALPPPRQWLLGNQFCRRFLSGLLAPGGTGKTAVRTLQAIALAVGKPLTGQHVFRRSRVLLVSLEDDKEEVDRRVAAALIHHDVNRDELKGWLFCASPKGFKLAEASKGSRHIGILEKMLRNAIERLRLGLIILDPFVKLHAMEENDNGAMDFVCDLLVQLAIEYNIAVDAPHHTRKGAITAGDADAGRGASSARDAGRLIYTLTRMTEEEAKAFSINPEERGLYVRLDSGKVNIAPPSREATWFRLVNVRLGNGNADYPNGDEVQTVEPWKPPKTWADLSSAQLNQVLTEIDGGVSNGQRYSDANAAGARAAWPVVQRHCPTKTEAQCREIIRTWVKTELLYHEDYEDPTDRKTRKGLRVDNSKRPGTEVRQ